MKRWIIAAVLAVVVLALGFGSWLSISVDSAGQFAVLSDGTIRYTHQLTNHTWHPLRYVVSADPASPVRMVLVTGTSSIPDKTVTSIQPSESDSPWQVAVSVPGKQQASIQVDFKLAEPLDRPSPMASTDMGGINPTVNVLLRVDR